MSKYHISNNYGFIKNPRIASQQNEIFQIAKTMDFLEVAIYDYPVETDSDEDLIARIQGIIASVESGDFIFLQLPTDNGPVFEEKLIRAIHEVKDTKVILLWHSKGYYLKHQHELSIWADGDCPPKQFYEAARQSKWHIKKMLFNTIDEINDVDATSDNLIHIGMGVHDKNGEYTSWLGVTMQSIIDHTQSKVCFHILHDETMTEINRHRLMHICRSSGNSIFFHSIEATCFDKQSQRMKGYTIGALFRILLPEICSDLSRILYLDSDLLINCDIRELWDIDIESYCLGAVLDEKVAKGWIWTKATSSHQVAKESYFNSGVIYMNLNKIRKKGKMKELVEKWLDENLDSDLPDQDALNVIYKDETLLIDQKWNTLVEDLRFKGDTKLKECIYHYVGTEPAVYFGKEIDYLYMNTLKKTPWGMSKYNFLLKRSLNRQLNQIRNLEDIIHSLLLNGDKKLIFYGSENASMKKLYDLLSVKNYESYRIAEDENNGILPCKKFSYLKELKKGSYLVFVLIQADGGKALSKLEALELKMNEDFFVIQNVMDVQDGGFLY